MHSTGSIEKFWAEFLRLTGRDASHRYAYCFYFGWNEALAEELLALVLAGRKRATCSSARSFEIEGDPLPKAGDMSVVTNWAGEPKCVIETTRVRVLPFREVGFDMAVREGEDDTLESWRQGHIRAFTHDAQAMGFEFSEDMPVVFEDFTVIYP
jgi:uncharacterized protein YhfF